MRHGGTVHVQMRCLVHVRGATSGNVLMYCQIIGN